MNNDDSINLKNFFFNKDAINEDKQYKKHK